MANQGFDPVKSIMGLRDSLNHIIEDGLSVAGGVQQLPVDVYETEQSVIIKTMPLIGVQPEEIDVSITGDMLTIRGETRPEDDVQAENYLRRERKYGPFSRSIPIPRPVKADQAVADFKDGVLIITLPKADEARPRTISVETTAKKVPNGSQPTGSQQNVPIPPPTHTTTL